MSSSFPALHFDNRNLRSLPVDGLRPVNAVREVRNAIFARVNPSPLKNPKLVAISRSALNLLASFDAFKEETEEEEVLAQVLSGNVLPANSEPAAHCYAGYQFGNFAGQLGDGAAISLGEVINGRGERWEVQLKGAGLTPFSRTADGRKVLRSSVREFLCSEAMHFLDIPTTRAGSVIASDTTVARDPFYDGNALDEKCCVVSRIAPNFFRFGSLEIFLTADKTGGREGPSARNESLKRQFVDFLIESYFPQCNRQEGGIYVNEDETVKYRLLFEEITSSTARLVAKWQAVGFVHGVLNTDNMSVLGLTLDFGPFAFMEQFDPEFTPNGSDGSARYSYMRQPEICKFNLRKLSEALSPLLSPADALQVLDSFDAKFADAYNEIMRRKLGLPAVNEKMVADLLTVMATTGADFTDTFVALTEFVEEGNERDTSSNALNALKDKIVSRCASPVERIDAIKRSLRISRLSLGLMPQQVEMIWSLLQSKESSVKAQVSDMFGGASLEVVAEEVGGEKRKLDRIRRGTLDIKSFETTSVEEQRAKNDLLWAPWINDFASIVEKYSAEQRRAAARDMRAVNPTFVLRNWVAQEAIAAAEKGDYSQVRAVLRMLETPFEPSFSTFRAADRDPAAVAPEVAHFAKRSPDWASRIICTCSS